MEEDHRRRHTVNDTSNEEIPIVTLSDSESDSMSVVSSSSSSTKPNFDESKIYALKSKMKKLKSKMKKLKLKSKMKKLKSKLKKLRAGEPTKSKATSIPPQHQHQHLIRIKLKTKDSIITKSVASASSFSGTSTNNARKTKLTCPNCHKTFADRKGIRYHVTMRVCQIKKEKSSHVQCPKCFKTYLFPTGLMKHAQSGKCSGKPMPTPTDYSKQNQSSTLPLLSTPLSSSSASSTSTCDICFKTFYDSGCFLRHMNTHTGEKQYQCDYCPYKSRLSYNIYKHLLTMHCEDYTPQFNCKLCSKSFGDQPNLLAHLSTDHGAGDEEKEEIACPFCSKIFRYRTEFDMHVKMHNDSGLGIPLFRCHEPQCSYVSRTGLGELQRHLRVLHNKWYLCQVCCKAFFQRSQFDEHLAEGETQTKTKNSNGAKSDENVEDSYELLVLTPKYCLICSKSFKSQCVLNQHVGDHFSQNVPFCHVCSQAFPTTTELTQHFTSAHPFEKERIYPVTCEKCHKSFKRRRKLMAHNQKRHPQENRESDESVN